MIFIYSSLKFPLRKINNLRIENLTFTHSSLIYIEL